MRMFSCHLALTFGSKNIRISDLSDITAPRTEFGPRLLRKSRMHAKKPSVSILVACRHKLIIQYEDGMNRIVL